LEKDSQNLINVKEEITESSIKIGTSIIDESGKKIGELLIPKLPDEWARFKKMYYKWYQCIPITFYSGTEKSEYVTVKIHWRIDGNIEQPAEIKPDPLRLHIKEEGKYEGNFDIRPPRSESRIRSIIMVVFVEKYPIIKLPLYPMQCHKRCTSDVRSFLDQRKRPKTEVDKEKLQDDNSIQKLLDDDSIPKLLDDDAIPKLLDDAIQTLLDDDAIQKLLDDDAIPKLLDDDAPSLMLSSPEDNGAVNLGQKKD